MKRIFLLFLTLALLMSVATAEIYPGACPHNVCVFDELMDEHRDAVLSLVADTTGFASGICTMCYEGFIFYTGGTENAQKLVCDGTTHIYQKEIGILEEGWYGDDSVGHTYRVYRAAKCVSCSELVKCYTRSEKMNDAGLQQHNWTEYGSLGYHVEGEKTHVYIITCTDCGFVATNEVPCIMYDHNFCNEEITKAKQFYIDK